VPSTPFDVYVFDFDGTLVRSAEAKRQAFFEVFPPACAEAVAQVLGDDPDGSRHLVIPRMIAAAQAMGLAGSDGLDAAMLVRAFGDAASRAVRSAAEIPGATMALRRAADRAHCYIASMTPEEDLISYLEARGWLALVRQAFGYPTPKVDVVASLLQRHGIAPGRLIVIGDGVSDKEAAARNGAAFHPVVSEASLATIPGLGDDGNA
jgi:phosphoglycolate phosphatase-like HAD superfamily hydrolase